MATAMTARTRFDHSVNVSLPICLLLSLVITALNCHAQGTFRNLDFEAAEIVPIPGDVYDRVQFDRAYPGWTGYIGSEKQDRTLHNDWYISICGISIMDRQYPDSEYIIGKSTALLQGGLWGSGQATDTMISQVGLIPPDAKSIQYMANYLFGTLAVKVGGKELTVKELGVEGLFTKYGADIQEWAGLEAELAFIAKGNDPTATRMYLDSIAFSTQIIPEPSSGWFLLAGISFFGFLRYAKRRFE